MQDPNALALALALLATTKALEFESDPTSVAFLTIFSKRSQPFSLPPSILTTLTLPAAAFRLAVFDALRPVPGPSDIGFRGAVGERRGVVDVVELVVERVVVQLVVRCRGYWLCCSIVLLWHWLRTVVCWCMGRCMCPIQGLGSCMSRRGILWRDPYAT